MVVPPPQRGTDVGVVEVQSVDPLQFVRSLHGGARPPDEVAVVNGVARGGIAGVFGVDMSRGEDPRGLEQPVSPRRVDRSRDRDQGSIDERLQTLADRSRPTDRLRRGQVERAGEAGQAAEQPTCRLLQERHRRCQDGLEAGMPLVPTRGPVGEDRLAALLEPALHLRRPHCADPGRQQLDAQGKTVHRVTERRNGGQIPFVSGLVAALGQSIDEETHGLGFSNDVGVLTRELQWWHRVAPLTGNVEGHPTGHEGGDPRGHLQEVGEPPAQIACDLLGVVDDHQELAGSKEPMERVGDGHARRYDDAEHLDQSGRHRSRSRGMGRVDPPHTVVPS